MTDSPEGPGPADAGASGAAGDDPGRGRLLDVAGVIAGVLLIVIVADILSDGRLVSRHLHRRGGETGDSPAE